jgi:hypothetical protein
VEFFDWEKNGSHRLVGTLYFRLFDVIDKEIRTWEFWSGKKDKSAGNLHLEKFTIKAKPSLLQIIEKGLKINTMVGIDFTASNMDADVPGSNHYQNPDKFTYNQYQEAIHSVVSVLSLYDYHKQIPCYGFGAKCRYPELHTTDCSHLFPLSGNSNATTAMNVDGVFGLYNYAIDNIIFSGPTYFAPLIKSALAQALRLAQTDPSNYTVLLILTDGVIDDMTQSIDLIIQCSDAPISIIIVGVGDEDFKMMVVLDNDAGTMKDSRGRPATRDCVQFVPFRNYQDGPTLAEAILFEIPDQILQVFKSKNLISGY